MAFNNTPTRHCYLCRDTGIAVTYTCFNTNPAPSSLSLYKYWSCSWMKTRLSSTIGYT